MAGAADRICIRFMSGNELFVDQGTTLDEIKVLVAKSEERFAPEVTAVNPVDGSIVEGENITELPPTLAVVLNQVVYDAHTWAETLRVHGRAADADGLRRALALIDEHHADPDAGAPERITGAELLNAAFFEECGRSSLSPSYLNTADDLLHGARIARIISTFLDAGADIDTENETGESSLFIAVREGRTPLVDHLLQARAHVNHTNGQQETCLFVASREGHLGIVDLLLSAHAEVHHIDRVGWTPLFEASCQGYEAIVDRLLNAGAQVDHEDNRGRTSLFAATREGRPLIVERLLEAGSNVNHVSKSGHTCIYYASLRGYRQLYDRLLKAGANVDDEHSQGDVIESHFRV